MRRRPSRVPSPPRLLLALAAVSLAVPAPPAGAQDPHGSSMTGEVVEGDDFLVYDEEGRPSSFAHLLEAMDDADALLVGESHDDAVGHAVEAQLLVRAAQRFDALDPTSEAERPVVLSLEMFERDVQYILDEYLQGLITEDQFLASARPWDRYETDYRPMVELARAHGLPVVAANAPRRYVNRVARLGPASLAELSERARGHLPPLPYPGPSRDYRAQWDSVMAAMMPAAEDGGEQAEDVGGAGDEGSGGADQESQGVREESPGVHEESPGGGQESPHPPPEASPNHDLGFALQAQALWDAAMGEAVARALERHPGALVLHYAGSFHVARGTGIPERIPEYRPGTKTVTVVMDPVEDIHAWDPGEHREMADFVILTRAPGEAGHGPAS